MKTLLFSVVLLSMGVSGSRAAEVQFESGVQQNQLIELYTSEGCSSCPPAEAYLNKLQNHPRLWQDVVPLAFHVDYWNDLGWRDRFSSPAYSARQRVYARHLRARTVYTPAFFVNGREWRRWFRRTPPANESRKIGNLQVNIEGERFQANFKPLIPLPDQLVLHVAILGMDRTTEIKAGENAGRLSSHQFVVLGHKAFRSEQRHWQSRLPQRNLEESGREALAVWVTRSSSPVPLQAAGGMLPNNAQ